MNNEVNRLRETTNKKPYGDMDSKKEERNLLKKIASGIKGDIKALLVLFGVQWLIGFLQVSIVVHRGIDITKGILKSMRGTMEGKIKFTKKILKAIKEITKSILFVIGALATVVVGCAMAGILFLSLFTVGMGVGLVLGAGKVLQIGGKSIVNLFKKERNCENQKNIKIINDTKKVQIKEEGRNINLSTQENRIILYEIPILETIKENSKVLSSLSSRNINNNVRENYKLSFRDESLKSKQIEYGMR